MAKVHCRGTSTNQCKITYSLSGEVNRDKVCTLLLILSCISVYSQPILELSLSHHWEKAERVKAAWCALRHSLVPEIL